MAVLVMMLGLLLPGAGRGIGGKAPLDAGLGPLPGLDGLVGRYVHRLSLDTTTPMTLTMLVMAWLRWWWPADLGMGRSLVAVPGESSNTRDSTPRAWEAARRPGFEVPLTRLSVLVHDTPQYGCPSRPVLMEG